MPFTRRTFLKAGSALTAGLPMLSLGATLRKRVIGCYTGVKEILESPAYLDALQEKLGVNTLLCGEAVRMPDWLREMNPLRKAFMFAQHTGDDSALRKAIEETHRRGMRFWLYFSGHHNNPDEREVMAETCDGLKYADLRIGKTPEEHGIWSDAAKSFYGYFNPDLTVKLMTREWTRLAAINHGRIPAHPVIKGYEWPEKVCRALMEQTEELGLDGYVFQRTERLIDRKNVN